MHVNANSCISCGMPMRTPEDHSLGDVSKPFCKYCGGQDGTLKSYEEVLAGMTALMRRTQGVDEEVARGAVREMMAKLPAWSGR